MSDPNCPDTTAKPSAFKRGDVAIFIGLPLLLAAGFGAFYWWRQHSADPNLRLIAQVTDDIAVELVAVAQYTGQTTPYTKWWKPNGLPAEGIVEDAAGMSLWGDHVNQRLFLVRVSERRSTVEPAVRGLLLTGNSVAGSSSDNGKTAIVVAEVSPTMLSTLPFGVKLASLGRQAVGVLTPEMRSMTSVVHGQHALIEVGNSRDTSTGYGPWAVKVTETISEGGRASLWQIHARDKSGQFIKKEKDETKSGPNCTYWDLRRADDWATITVERTMYDKEVVFDGVSAFEGSFTSPRVDYVGPVRSK